MFLLRLLAFFYLVYCVTYFARSLLGAMPQSRGPRPQGGPRPPPPGFDDFGPYGPFGPFGPFGQQQQQTGQRRTYQQAPPRPPPRAEEPSPYTILGVSPGASSEEVRKAYQNKVREYHPDRTGNLPKELRDLAERRTKEITNAYNQLKRGR